MKILLKQSNDLCMGNDKIFIVPSGGDLLLFLLFVKKNTMGQIHCEDLDHTDLPPAGLSQL